MLLSLLRKQLANAPPQQKNDRSAMTAIRPLVDTCVTSAVKTVELLTLDRENNLTGIYR